MFATYSKKTLLAYLAVVLPLAAVIFFSVFYPRAPLWRAEADLLFAPRAAAGTEQLALLSEGSRFLAGKQEFVDRLDKELFSRGQRKLEAKEIEALRTRLLPVGVGVEVSGRDRERVIALAAAAAEVLSKQVGEFYAPGKDWRVFVLPTEVESLSPWRIFDLAVSLVGAAVLAAAVFAAVFASSPTPSPFITDVRRGMTDARLSHLPVEESEPETVAEPDYMRDVYADYDREISRALEEKNRERSVPAPEPEKVISEEFSPAQIETENEEKETKAEPVAELSETKEERKSPSALKEEEEKVAEKMPLPKQTEESGEKTALPAAAAPPSNLPLAEEESSPEESSDEEPSESESREPSPEEIKRKLNELLRGGKKFNLSKSVRKS
ncbi:MAG TPA: hypothetical protein ENJ77_00265 [Candidatus Moranbacteria bacterium]|nr:hypothetical protein [Candidatus Moranbacteria bacterium]